jgi:hypothetical protein
MRVLVFGGRDWKKRKLTYAALDQLDKEYGFSVVIDGMAPGADELAFDWALSRGVKTERYAADWDKYGRAAGPIRNQQMIEALPDVAVAFPGGTGTADMARRCRAAGVLVREVSVK